jgi:nitrate reductase NapD
MNICGCLVHIAPDKTLSARQALTDTRGVAIHAEADDGRFVVVVEDTDARLASETIMELHQIPGVISLSLTYHHFEDLAETGPRPASPRQSTSRRQFQ